MKRPLLLSLLLAACQAAPTPSHAEKPAYVEHPVAESDLAVVRLSAQALQRLAIETAKVERNAVPDVRLVGGEVIVPPGRTTSVTAALGGMVRAAGNEGALMPGARVRRGQVLFSLVPLAPVDRDVQARAEREVAAAHAQLAAAEARMSRLTQLEAERASSQRLVEEATATRDVARADLAAAETRARSIQQTPLLSDVALTVRAPADGIVRTLAAVPGQAVAAGAPLVELVAVDALQIRVPVYAGDLARVDLTLQARVRALSADPAMTVSADPVAGPPTADGAAITVDRYYALGPDGSYAPGERVLVELPMRTRSEARTLPAASVVRDAEGAAWVYACAGEHAFKRARIDPLRVAGDRVVFERGPPLGACVVSVGAAEIFGSEFEPGH